MGQTKWINNHTNNRFSSRESYALNRVEIGKNKTICSRKYFSQWGQLKVAIDNKHKELVNRKSVIFSRDNVRQYVSLMNEKIVRLGVFIHQPHSVNISSLDYYLFYS